jgi:mono/diheme cytochrome c family protein
MKKIIKGIFILSGLLLLFSACYNDNEYDLYPFSSTPCDSSNVTYSQTIAPIMSANCNVCHSTAVASGNVTTDTWTGLSTVALNGKLWGGVSWASGYKNMPNGGSQLSPCELGKIKKWINQGAPNN